VLFAVGLALAMGLGVAGGLLGLLHPGLAALVPVALVLALVLLVGRLGLWGVLTVANDRSSVRDAWVSSKTGFWSLVGSYLIWIVVTLIASALWAGIMQIIAGALGARTSAGIPGDFAGLLTPGWLFYLFSTGVMSGVISLACTRGRQADRPGSVSLVQDLRIGDVHQDASVSSRPPSAPTSADSPLPRMPPLAPMPQASPVSST
jgi:hypothetical protein